MEVMVSFTPGEGAPVLIEEEARWVPQPVWTFRELKNILPLPVFEPRIVEPVAWTL
jgi:hypothetical protein